MNSGGFLSHLEALRKMILEILAIFVVLLIPGWYLAPELLEFLQHSAAGMVPQDAGNGFELSYFSLMEPFIVELKSGMIIAFAVGLPLYFWRLWKFLAPALYERERRFIMWGAVAAWLLFIAGFSLGVFGVMPLLVKFSASFARGGLTPVIGLDNFIGLLMTVALAFGAMFELPIILLALILAKVVELDSLRRQRPLVLVVILILAAFLTPPDIISQLMLGIPTYMLFELTLLVGACMMKKDHAGENKSVPDMEYCNDNADEDTEFNGKSEDEPSDSVGEDMPTYYRRRRRHSGSLPRRKKTYRQER